MSFLPSLEAFSHARISLLSFPNFTSNQHQNLQAASIQRRKRASTLPEEEIIKMSTFPKLVPAFTTHVSLLIEVAVRCPVRLRLSTKHRF
jgi:hypothetical protein